MEQVLHYVWKYKLYTSASLTTTDGTPVTVIDPGIHNNNAGPDFFNAKVKIGDTLWAGSVELHLRASDWYRHNHQDDKVYDTVILHVVEKNDTPVNRQNGELIPAIEIEVPPQVRDNIHWLLHKEKAMPCLPFLSELESIHLASWMNVLLTERLERKVDDIEALLQCYQNDWNEVFYVLLTRNFGFGVNNDAFEWLAKSLPLRYIQKQRNSRSQIEAMLFGQAGMLQEEGGDEYYRLLRREYLFLKQKFSLKPLDESLFKKSRTRPGNFPYIKLAQLAAIWSAHDTLFSVLREAGNLRQIKSYLTTAPSDYWLTHFKFNTPSHYKTKVLSDGMLDILLINTVVPLFFAWGRKHDYPEYMERGISILERIKPECNSIVDTFAKAGIVVEHAGDSQALIQLKRCYCEQKKCMYCRIGFRLLKRSFLL